MHAVGSLAWRILFSLTFMSNLFREFSCESIVHNTDIGLEQRILENQTQEMRTEYVKQQILNSSGIHQTPNPKVIIPSKEANAGKSGIVGDDGYGSKQPSMNVMFHMSKEELLQETPTARKRRYSSGQEDVSQKCQRHQLYVNFTTLGYDKWLVAPKGYMAYYCAGECTLPFVTTTNHTGIKNYMRKFNPNIPKPCCVPTKLSPINVITNINSQVEKGTWHNMVVDKCHCI